MTPVNLTLADGTTLRTGKRTDAGPQNVVLQGRGLRPPDGFSVNVGTGGFVTHAYQAEITAIGPGGSTVELESRIGRLEAR